MHKLLRVLHSATAVAALAAAFVVSPLAPPAQAMGDPPKPTVDCKKKANKDKAECKPKATDQLSDDEIYYGGYYLAKAGDYQAALDLLRRAKNQNEPRILNYIGFATRKLGRVDEAMVYYSKALDLDPNYTVARAYLGEAFLQQGDAVRAKEELAEIAARCGTTCTEFVELSGHIARFERTGASKS